ncbi:MAG: hypothetical protein LBN97_01435 [Oscillospiraceae bacterium]|jgi:hypothetical protein|nr:hypothetical protein [Oscillospiraceae bacterium]
MVKRIIPLALILALSMTFAASSFANAETLYVRKYPQDFTAKEWTEAELKQSVDTGKTADNMFANFGELLPESFAGCYIENGGRLVILLVDGTDTEEERRKYRDKAHSDDLLFDVAEFSWRSQEAVREKLTDALISDKLRGYGVWSVSDDVYGNRVAVSYDGDMPPEQVASELAAAYGFDARLLTLEQAPNTVTYA